MIRRPLFRNSGGRRLCFSTCWPGQSRIRSRAMCVQAVFCNCRKTNRSATNIAEARFPEGERIHELLLVKMPFQVHSFQSLDACSRRRNEAEVSRSALRLLTSAVTRSAGGAE